MLMAVVAFGVVAGVSADEKGTEVSAAESVAVKALNEAKIADLVKLSGIGKVTAEAIIAHREKNGSFKQLTDLFKVTDAKGKAVFAGSVEKPGKRYTKACAALKEIAEKGKKKS
jgi:competence ComEA-like helix-hairpin-helix protein